MPVIVELKPTDGQKATVANSVSWLCANKLPLLPVFNPQGTLQRRNSFSKRNTKADLWLSQGDGAGKVKTPARLFVALPVPGVSLHMAKCTRHDRQECECSR